MANLILCGSCSDVIANNRCPADPEVPVRDAAGEGPGGRRPPEDLLALHEALERFARHDPLKAKLVEPRFVASAD
jgi:hypothetical protein